MINNYSNNRKSSKRINLRPVFCFTYPLISQLNYFANQPSHSRLTRAEGIVSSEGCDEALEGKQDAAADTISMYVQEMRIF